MGTGMDIGPVDLTVDLRSDTVTRPTPEMRRAMADAVVGDDVYGEDPTVNALQEAYAERVGKPAALFVPSGVMANQIALRILAPAGTVVVAGRRQHVVVYENGAGGRNAGIQFHAVDDTDGTVHPDEVAWVIAAAHHHHPRPGLLCLENTHMPANGTPWPIERLRETAAVATACGFPVHLDGARLFNAEVATGTAAADYAAPVTTVMSCLSKGLGAPVGSVLAGPADVIDEARTERARLGGGMRQAGVIAAAGLVALTTMVERLADDHRRARVLAEAVAERWPDAGCDPAKIRTNVVTWTHHHADQVVHRLAGAGVLVGTIAPGVLRLVTHFDVDDDGLARAVAAIRANPE
jgi:threonine aldolase